jgi:hypothetical protein
MHREAENQNHSKIDLSPRGATADREALPEVMKADSYCDEERKTPGGRPRSESCAAGCQLTHGHGPRTEELGSPAAGEPSFVGDEAYEPDPQARKEQRRVAYHWPEPALMTVYLAQGPINGLPGVRQDVPQKEDQNADGERVQELTQA